MHFFHLQLSVIVLNIILHLWCFVNFECLFQVMVTGQDSEWRPCGFDMFSRCDLASCVVCFLFCLDVRFADILSCILTGCIYRILWRKRRRLILPRLSHCCGNASTRRNPTLAVSLCNGSLVSCLFPRLTLWRFCLNCSTRYFWSSATKTKKSETCKILKTSALLTL